ncbi:glycosyltransferase family 4 protein [Polynucleobacter sp. JS-JIR-II-b4]|uniref:glycosyltransferase family 4 protein n=1 Tax=Polynucleobacter sp. JS-JIR-II-b4 TaxID=1758390 RepID=UPI001BFDA958|nr:glycosyltransferase [Polynucleobacter sp. JS-JIR-II-b4]QWE02841.1 glycosyltransferase family 4 protein [Polynucleobacter sp. JS-JIR-II-b4]
MFEGEILSTFLAGMLTSILVLLVITHTREIHEVWTSGPKEAIQKMHAGAVPRIGGIGILLGMGVMVVVYRPINSIVFSTFIASSFIFAIGFAEDLSNKIKVSWRLLLTFIPGIFIAVNSGIYLTHFGWGWIDSLLSIQFLAIGFTAFALAGVSHAFNMIDGLNGLVSFTSLWILGAYLSLGFYYDDLLIVHMCLLLAAPILGFLLFNWPLGKCFLGDGGAYLIGFFLAFIGVLLAERHLVISPFAPLLICSYPIIEVLYSSVRRILKGRNSGAPDNQHLHQLFKFRLIKPLLKKHNLQTVIINSITGFAISLICSPFLVLAVLFKTDQNVLIGLFLIEFFLYRFLYRFLVNSNVELKAIVKSFK